MDKISWKKTKRWNASIILIIIKTQEFWPLELVYLGPLDWSFGLQSTVWYVFSKNLYALEKQSFEEKVKKEISLQKKRSFPFNDFVRKMWLNPQKTADSVTFTGEMISGKLHFLCRVLPESILWRRLVLGGPIAISCLRLMRRIMR